MTHFEKEYPTFYTTVWISKEKHLGIAISNIAIKPYELTLDFNIASYELPAKSGTIYSIDTIGRHIIGEYKNGQVMWSGKIPGNTSSLIAIE